MIPPAFKQDLIARVDIVEIVGRAVELKKAGVSHKGLCPFHAEKSPSFTVSPSRQTYHCFGCGAHGNAIDFLMEHDGMGFIDAVRDLAQQTGMAVPEDESTPAEREQQQAQRLRQGTLTETLGKAAEGYQRQLKASPKAIAYLKGRGVSGEIAARFGLGFAPESWRGLASVFPSYDDPLLEESGLVITQGDDDVDPEQRKRYDRFRNRLMFPIRSVQGDVIGFGGRVLDDSQPKYLNSPETPVFSKGRELYGLHEARTAIRERGYALVVEGYMDVVALAQSGFGNAVATLGTACTAEHVQKLFRFTDSVVFSFDGDGAGRRAATRALEASLPHASDTRTLRFVFLPPEHDPDSFVRENGDAAFEAVIANAVPLSRQMLEVARTDVDLATPEGRARFVAQAKPLWSALPVGMLKRQVLAEIASLAALSREELALEWRVQTAASTAPMRSSTTTRRAGPARTVMRRPADRVAWMLLLENGWWELLGAADREALCQLPGWHGELFHYIDQGMAEHGAMPWAALRERVTSEPWGPTAIDLVAAEDASIEPSLEDLHKSIDQMHRAVDTRDAMRLLGRL